MSCEICGRGSCTRSFHSIEAQEEFDERQSMSDDVGTLREELQSARAELAALRADAERYRWLRGEVHGPRVPLAQVLWKLNNIRDNFRWTNLSGGQTLDEHIDAARGDS